MLKEGFGDAGLRRWEGCELGKEGRGGLTIHYRLSEQVQHIPQQI